jgi:hypothetical protein
MVIPFRLFLLKIALSAFFVFSSCSQLDKALLQWDNTNAILEDAISKIDKNSQDWLAALKEAQVKLTEDAQAIIRHDLSIVLERATAEAATQIKCLVDFVGQRVKSELQRILDERRCIKPILICKMSVCTSSPSSVELKGMKVSDDEVKFYGHDFNKHEKLKTVVVDASGNIIMVDTTNLTVNTHYLMTLNLSGNGLKIDSRAKNIIIFCGNTEISRVSVKLKEPDPCVLKNVTLSPQSTNFAWKPPHLPNNRADAIFGCGRMNFYYSVSLRITADGKEVKALVYMFGQECCHAALPLNCSCGNSINCQSQVGGSAPEQTIYVAPNNAKITEILSNVYYRCSNTDLPGDDIDVKIDAGGDNSVSYIICNSPRSGVGVTGNITWKSIRVQVCQN